MQIANVLLHNKEKWDTDRDPGDGAKHRPILVVCYTNHALDQFLEGIHQFHPKGIVRVGGRSQSETMKACSLSQLKHDMHEVRVHIQNSLGKHPPPAGGERKSHKKVRGYSSDIFKRTPK